MYEIIIVIFENQNISDKFYVTSFIIKKLLQARAECSTGVAMTRWGIYSIPLFCPFLKAPKASKLWWWIIG